MSDEVATVDQSLLYGEITEKVIGAAFRVHNSLGKGLSEKVYEQAMMNAIRDLGLPVEHQKSLPVFFENSKVGEQIVDLLVDDKVIVELKAVQQLSEDHHSQLLGYLKNTQFQVGLLINFGDRVQFKRLIYTSQHK